MGKKTENKKDNQQKKPMGKTADNKGKQHDTPIKTDLIDIILRLTNTTVEVSPFSVQEMVSVDPA